MKPYHKLILICLGALIFRIITAQFVHHPGIGDPNHYYNLGMQLVEGHGFNIDYIWHYNDIHPDIVHPDDHWLPLSGVLAASGMLLLGENIFAALLPFIVIGALLCGVGYWAARQFGCGENASLFAAAAVGVLPEFVLNSVRTDTTIPFSLFVCGSILLLNRGLKNGGGWSFLGSGVLAGLAYLARNDAILLLPMLVMTLIVYAMWGKLKRGYLVILMPLAALLVAAPWLIRNVQVLGYATPLETRYMYFYTDQRDHYSYMREFSLETMLAQQTPAQIIGKRLFEIAAAAKLLYTTLDIFLPVAVLGGLALLILARDRERLLIFAPTLILLGGAFFFYTVFVPYKSQSGSFKKFDLALIPLLIPLAAYALERVVSDSRIRMGTMILTLVFLSANAIELVRADAHFTDTYLDYIRATVKTAQSLPDTNGDGQIILMAQDPFMLRYFGMRSVMVPMESREKVLEAAQDYHVDYLMMPPDRPSLDPLYLGTESDPRFIHAADVPDTNVKLFGFDFEASAAP
jgi:Dolichyl-phosphate-mannose-protein mannosyltransferase